MNNCEDGDCKFRIILFFILSFGLLLRLWGIEFGLPFFKHVDEGIYLPRAIQMLETLDFNPRYFENPPFLIYLQAVILSLFIGIAKIFGLSLQNIGMAQNSDYMTFYLIMRIVNVLFAVSTCFILYGIGKKLFNRMTGLLSVAILSFCFLHVRDSHYAVNDIPATFFMMMAFKYAVDFYYSGLKRDLVFSAIFIGITAATKYYMGFVLAPLLIAIFIRNNKDKKKACEAAFVACCVSFISFFIFCPWFLLDSRHFFPGFLLQAFKLKQLGNSISYIKIIKTILWGYGLFPAAFALISLFYLLREWRKLALILVTPLCFLLFFGQAKWFAIRFVIPILPYLCLLSSYGIFVISKPFLEKKAIFSVFFLSFFVMFQGIVFSFRHNYLISKTDTRTIARNWIRNNIPVNSKILQDRYTPNLKDFCGKGYVNNYQIMEIKDPGESEYQNKNIGEYKKEGYEYIITSDYIQNICLGFPTIYPMAPNFYASLEKYGRIIYHIAPAAKKQVYYGCDNFSPFWNLFILDSLGPEIIIYKL